MHKSRFRIITALAIVGVVGLASADVDAAAVSYPGLNCKLRPLTTNGTIGEYGGTLSSTHGTNDANVICPFIHYTGSWLEAADVRVWDRHSTKNVSCTIYWETAFQGGSIGSYSDTGTSTGNNNNLQTISLTMDPEDSGEYVYGRCTVPNIQSGSNPSHILQWKTYDTR